MVETRGGRRFALVFFVAAFALLFAGRWLSPVNHVAMTVTAPFQSVLTGVTNTIGDAFAGVFDGPRLRAQNQMLRREVETALATNVRLRDAAIENHHLSALFHLQTQRPDLKLLPAKVIGNCQDMNLDPCIFIDRGSRDGLTDHMTVVDPQGAYVGYVSDLAGTAARVMLLSNPSSSVGVRDVRSRATGVVEGQYAGNPQLSYVQTNQGLQVGDFVETSGQYELFPTGVVVGQIQSIRRSDVGLFQSASIAPVADFSSLERVAVITGFHPANLGRLIKKP